MTSAATAAGWSHPDLFSFWLAGTLAVFVVAVRRLASAPWLVGGAVFLALASVAVVSTQFDLVGWHGFMHAGPMLRILDGGPVPPEDPLFAGATLRYPWAEHWLMARLALATGLNPHFLTIGIEVLVFGGFLACGAWLASMVTRDREVIALSVLLTGFGVSVFHGGVLQDALLRAFPWLSMETRVVPLDKFGSITGMPIGYTAMALASCCGVKLACREGSTRLLAAVVAASTLVAALIHPLSWTGILAFEGVVGLVLLASRRRDDLGRALWLAAAVALPSLAVLPYLRAIGASASSDGWTGVTWPGALLAAKTTDLAIFFLPMALLAYFGRDRLLGLLEDGNRALRVLVLVILAMAAAHLVVRFPGRNEYKFLLFAAPSGAVVLALCLQDVLERHLLAGLVVLGLLLLPGARDLGFRPWFVVTDPCRADGYYLRSMDPAADELYQWVAANTPGNAVFLAADLRIPPLARRGLYIAVEQPWRGRDGWGLPRNQLLQWHIRQPDAVMYRRQHLATLVLDANWSTEKPVDVIAAIHADVPGRPLYVHSQNRDAAARLEKTPGFTLRFRNAAGSVFSVAG